MFSAADRDQLRYSACGAGESNLSDEPAEIIAEEVKFAVPTLHAWFYSLSQLRWVAGLGEDSVPE